MADQRVVDQGRTEYEVRRSWLRPQPDRARDRPPAARAPVRYTTRPVHPRTLTLARAGLWAAIALGGVGGFVALTRPTRPAPAPVAESSPDGTVVPTPVAGVAELAIEAWLTAGQDDDGATGSGTSDDEGDELLADLFVDPPPVDDADTEGLTVDRVTTVAGERLEDGYWTVTVAADVREASSTTQETTASRWFVEVAVVGDLDGGGLAALGIPSLVPEPPAVPDGWRVSDGDGYAPEDDDPVVVTVEGFLTSLLTGEGDASRWLGPDLAPPVLEPPPFEEVEVTETRLDDLDSGDVVAWVQALGTTPGGLRQVVGYELVLAERDGRWEVVEISGAATFIERDTPD